jgi:iron complex outermembrane receptor protein
LRDVLQRLVPSFQVQMVSSASWNSVTRPAGLRGLSGAHVLVLVDGKRRHNSSMIDFNPGNQANRANPVDLDLIPAGAIRRIEVLRDGAAAQYGSDAIAGVINIILKTQDSGADFDLYGSQRFEYHGHSDGQTVKGDAVAGFALPWGGSSTLAIEARSQEASIRSIPALGAFYFPVNGQPDPREATVDKITYKGGLPEVRSVTLSDNTRVPIGDMTAYSVLTFGVRHAEVGQAGRKPNSNQDIPEIYPDGFTPYFILDEHDYQALFGLKGELGGWTWELSSTYGENIARGGAKNTLNASLGPASPTRFGLFRSDFRQWTSTLDLTRSVKAVGERPLQVSTGLEHRYEGYRTTALDPLAYANGGYVYPSGPLKGQRAQVGAQGEVTLQPADQADNSRNNFAAYVDLSLDATDRWLVAAAGRYEHYDDSAGDVWSGKLSTRYELTPALSARLTVSNGFRAPSLPQEGFARTATQFSNINGVVTAVDAKTVTVSSPLGRALGATPLTPEKSVNIGAGLTFHPLAGLSATLDAYRIELKNRVLLTSLLSGSGVGAILTANGFNPNLTVSYFTNAADTQTDGVDFVGNHHQELARFGAADFTLAVNWNRTRITHLKNNPGQLAGLGLTLFDRQSRGYITDLIPRTKVIASVEWKLDRWRVGLTGTRYDSFWLRQNNPATDEHYGQKTLTDLEIEYAFTENLRMGIGANNLFDVYPSALKAVNTIGAPPYSNFSPFGNNGGFYYAKISGRF